METSHGEQEELMNYLTRISSYHSLQIKSESSVLGIIWGTILIIAGIFDYHMVLTTNIYPSFIHWAFLVFLGYFIQKLIISTSTTLPDELDSVRDKVGVFEITVVISTFLLTNLIYSLGKWLIIPFVSLVLGIINLRENYKNPSPFEQLKNVNLYSAIIFFSSSVITVSLVLLLGTEFGRFNGLIFGIISGVGHIGLGYRGLRDLRAKLIN